MKKKLLNGNFQIDSTDDFFSTCRDFLVDYLNDKYSNHFIYGNLSYFDFLNKRKLKTCYEPIISPINTNLPELRKALIDAFLKINSENMFSFTKYILKREKLFLVIEENPKCQFELNKENEDDLSIYIKIPCLKTLEELTIRNLDRNFIDDIFDSYNYAEKNIETNQFVNTLLYYKNNISKNIINHEKPIYYYFIRPSLMSDSYNGLLYIALQEKLKLNDIYFLSLGISHFFLKIVLYEKDANAIRSAVAAIMSRQMSHNLGSHVIPGTKYNIKNGIFDDKDKNGVIRLFHYLQERMDFISMIVNTQEENKLHGCLNLKAHILDELAMDGPAIRHKSKDTERCSNFILRHIVKSENIYRFESKDENKNFIKEGEYINHIPIELQIIKKVQDEYKIFTSIDNGDVKSNDFSQIEFSIPYGVNGRHAFLNILEDFIRNSAKHNNASIENLNTLVFSILIDENDDSQNTEIKIDDNEYLVTIFSNKPSNNDELKTIIKAFSSLRFLDDKNTIDQNNKGLKEILICLAWLKDKMQDLTIIEDQIIQNSNKIPEFRSLSSDTKSLCEYALIDAPLQIETNLNIKNSRDKYLGLRFTLPKYRFAYFIRETLIDTNGQPNYIDIFNLFAAEIYILENDTHFDLLSKIIPRLVKASDICDKSLVNKLLNNDNSFNLTNSEKASIYKDYLSSIGKVNLPELFILRKDPEEREEEYTNHVFRFEDNLNHVTQYNGDIILFKEHNDIASQFNQTFQTIEKAGIKKQIKFIEGISGGNYTFNLVISNIINELEYYRIIDSSLTRIAIIDERLFEHFEGELPKSTSDINIETFDTNSLVNRLVEIVQDDNEEWQTSIQTFHNNSIFISDENFQALCLLKDTSELKKEILSLIRKNDQFYFNGNFLESKRIFIYNFFENKHVLSDLQGNRFDSSKNSYDYISIHYGIIEKYKEGDKEMDIVRRYEDFLLNVLGIDVKKSSTKIAIHSGRGNLTGLENKATFLPISTIESQLLNCKFLLTQQFANIKYKF